MAVTRIQFRDPDGTNTFTCDFNPIDVIEGDSTDYSVAMVLDGAGIRVVTSFDNRPRRLTWDDFDYGNDSGVGVRFDAMVSELKTYRGSAKELHLQDIETDTARGFKDVFIDDVTTKIVRGASKNIRRVVEILFRYTEAI